MASSGAPYAGLVALAACSPETPAVTWSEHVAPIVERHCLGCHSQDGIGPFSLERYEDAVVVAEEMRIAVAERVMPPWGIDASGACQSYSTLAHVTDDEIETIGAWVDRGLVRGSRVRTDLEASPDADDTWGTARTVDIGADYTPDSQRSDDYRCFLIDPGLERDAFLRGYRVRPGASRIVHHAILFGLDTALAEQAAGALDAADEPAGYSCFGGPGVASRPLGGWAPGTPGTVYPEQTGVRLMGSRPLVVQIHYHVEDQPVADRTEIDLAVVDAVDNEAFVYGVADPTFSLEPGRENVQATFELPLAAIGLPIGVTVRGVYPHMHVLGRQLRVEAVRASETRCLVDVPRWDFQWQQMYFYQSPVYLYPDETLRITCSYDTRGRDRPVRWGEGTLDEMCLAGMVFTLF